MCTGLVQLLHLQPERLGPHMQSIIEYMLESTQVQPPPVSDQNKSLRMQKCTLAHGGFF